MNTRTRKTIAGIALLLIGLSLTTAVNLTATRIARANPGVLYAAPNGMTSGACDTWANACTLQRALSIAVSGDEIWVKAGVHYPGAAGNRDASFTLKNGVALYGGFAGWETSRDQRDWQANPTILSGDIDQNDTNTDGNYIAETWEDIVGNNAYHVVTADDTVQTAVLDGFIITAGQANGSSPNYNGGGMYNSGSPILANVTFSGNTASYDGGGMYNEYSSPTLTNVTFSGNSAGWGGGISQWGGYLTLTNTTFISNTAAGHGGGMYSSYSSATLTNVTFSSNSANNRGGGMYNSMSGTTLTNVVFNDNSATFYGGGMCNGFVGDHHLTNVAFSGNSAEYGGGIYNYSDNGLTLTNVTLSANAADHGGGIYNHLRNILTLANVIIWGNAATVRGDSIYNYDNSNTLTISHSDIQGCGGSDNWNNACGVDDGNNIEADPLFMDAAGGNLRLKEGSPAIDAGNNAAVPPGVTTDLDGNPRIDYIVDMGAYEYQAGPGLRPFGKALPLNGNSSQPLTPTLSWRASAFANTYAYCYDTSENNACDTTWITTTETSAQIGGLSQGTTYYWQVRAVNNDGTREADGGEWWSFTTAPSRPGFFSKTSPPKGLERALVAPALSWSASPGAEQYEYCYDTTNDNACATWLSAGAAISVTLPALLPDTTYYWQVRAVNAYGTSYANGRSTDFWSFTTYHLPGDFNKTSPADGSDQVNSVTLSWGASADADTYEYCYDTTNDNTCSTWLSAGTNRSVTLNDLDPNATYYWQVRARNAGGVTYADGSSAAFWSFRTSLVRWDGQTNKPYDNRVWFWTNLARTQWRRFRLRYTYTGYCQGVLNEITTEFQFDGPGNITGGAFGDSSATFSFTGQLNSPTTAAGTFTITNLRLVLQGTSGTCTVYVNDSGTWTASRPLLRPGAFGKAQPPNGATNQNTTLALWWDPSTDAAEYQYCLDTTANDACDTNWVSRGTNLGVDLSGLAENTTYYWQVRAINAQGTTYADGGGWWSFRTRDTVAPTVLSSVRLDPSPTSAASVRFRVAFSEPVTGVDAADFSLTVSGITGAAVTGVEGTGAAYTVTVGTGSGSGTLRLDVPATASINDLAGNPLTGLPYTGGESYTIDKTAPTVLSSVRLDASPTNAASVRFRVTFSEDVTGVDAADFSLTASGVTGASVTGVEGTGAVYTITVGTGSGTGTLRLDVPATAGIADLAGNPLSGLPYTGGEAYMVRPYFIHLPLVLRNTP